MSLAKKPIALAVSASTVPLPPAEPPKCKDCAHHRIYASFGAGMKFVRPGEHGHPVHGIDACYDEEHNRGMPCADVREDEDACGPDGDWFAPRIVVIQ